MDKKVIILAALAAVGGVGLGVLRSPAKQAAAAKEDVFAEEKLKGYAQNTQIKVLDDGKSASGRSGGPVIAVAVAPYGVSPAQISPTGYGALKALRRQYRDADWIAVFIAEDSAMAEASNWIGLAQYRKGEVVVTGGIPSEAELAHLGPGGKPLRRPTREDLKVAAAVFDSTGSLSAARWDLSQGLLAAGQGRLDRTHFFDLDLETSALHAVAKAMGRETKEVQATVTGVTRYYWAKAGEPL